MSYRLQPSLSEDLAKVWSDEGREAMVKTAKANPTVFFATCARLIPQDVKLTVEQQLPGNLSPEDWTIMREIVATVRRAIPDASSKPPSQVLEFVLEALRTAKTVDCPEKVLRTVRIRPAPKKPDCYAVADLAPPHFFWTVKI